MARKWDGVIQFVTVQSRSTFQKFYYLFRCINSYGFFSNPTEIWEVEITEDADETFLHANVVGFSKGKQDKFKLTKTMSRLMQVVPSLNQSTFLTNQLPEEASDLSYYNGVGDRQIPTLGVVDEKMWGEDSDDEDDNKDAPNEDEKFEKDSAMKGEALEDEMRTKGEDEVF